MAASLAAGGAAAAESGGDLFEAVRAGKPLLDLRPRYEFVDQDNFAKSADAFTVRAQLGWETAAWNHLKALAEIEAVQGLGDHYNSTTNGKTAYPVVADPNVVELNRAQIAWTPGPGFAATLGRQIISIDDQRFIGSAAWRQDEQTFDAARMDLKSGPFSASYVYIERVNRVFAQAQDWDSDSHAAVATYAVGKPLKLEGFVYALAFKQSAANSTLTFGVRATGALAGGGPVKLAYAAAYAHQRDYRANPGRFGLDYWDGEVSASRGPFTLKGAYESLGGDGARGFATPLATLHAFQGWADVFLTTPSNGIRDANLALTVKPRLTVARFSDITLTGVYHDFAAARGGADLGRELDLQATAAITKQLSALVKFADYDGVPGFASRRKVWVGLEFKL
jgi:hypothetical protein